jgi:hypothetical protein
LQMLNLDGNKIKRIQGLENLHNLQQLWLNSNQLTALEGLATLTSLQQLWVGRNRIAHIGTALDRNVNLTELNISDNKLGCFKDLDNLARLPSLSNLALNDPHFSPNPVCMLCNYQTYALYQLTQLTCLDALVLSDEAKHLAQATFSKKKMYYNMRIKTLKRNTTNVYRRAHSAMEVRLHGISSLIVSLERQLRDVERADSSGASDAAAKLRAGLARKYGERERVQVCGTCAALIFYASWHAFDCLQCLHFLNGAVELVASMMSHSAGTADCVESSPAGYLRAAHSPHGAGAYNWRYARRMLGVYKIMSGALKALLASHFFTRVQGNIRLEDGKPGDVWHSSCVDLIHSRFNSRDFATVGIRGVKVCMFAHVNSIAQHVIVSDF